MKQKEKFDNSEEDFNLNLIRQSQLFKDARKRKHQAKQVDEYDRQVIQQSMKKSYIIKMASKTKKAIKSQNKKGKPQNEGGMMRSKIQKTFCKPAKIFNNIKNVQRTEFHVQDISQQKNKTINFDCCYIENKGVFCFLKFQSDVELSIYDRDQKKLLYSFNFNTIKARVKHPNASKNSNGFILKAGSQTKLMLQCVKNYQFQDLAQEKIKDMISKSDGKVNKLEEICLKQPNFYKHRYRTAIQFSQKCQTGDILLFQGSHFFAGVQRFLTNSNFDHVGMVIRDPQYGILIFQSNSSTGVCLTPWEYLIKYEWYESIQKIVWRQLVNIERDQDFQILIHEFVKANLGKNYFISINKLVSNRSYIAQNDDQVGYFCSELVAKLYKDLGLLTRNRTKKEFKPSNNFYPYHFSQKYHLQLIKGSLSSEYELYFNKQKLVQYYQ